MRYAIFGATIFVLAGAAWWFLSGESVEEPIVGSEPPPMHSDEIIGHSVEGREIIAYTYGVGPTKLLFVGGIHGGYEWNSVALAYRFIEYLSEHPEAVPEHLTVAIIPDLNPDAVYEAIGKEGPFGEEDVPKDKDLSGSRFNSNDVDLNRNFDCKWKPKSSWRSRTVSAGTEPFSEPEARALKGFVTVFAPSAVVVWHSQANAVYASECTEGILPKTREIMGWYAKAAGYPEIDSFDAYEVTGDAEGWLASIGIPAITVELSSHDTIEWDKNFAGFRALLDHF